MCHGIQYDCSECRRTALPTRWNCCQQCPLHVLSNKADASIHEDMSARNRIPVPKGCINLVITERKTVCSTCQEKADAKRAKKEAKKESRGKMLRWVKRMLTLKLVK